MVMIMDVRGNILPYRDLYGKILGYSARVPVLPEKAGGSHGAPEKRRLDGASWRLARASLARIARALNPRRMA